STTRTRSAIFELGGYHGASDRCKQIEIHRGAVPGYIPGSGGAVKILATIVLGGALAACASGPNCEVCPAMGNACVPPGACTPASCQRPIVSSALPNEQVQYLGTHKVGTELPFTVPADAGSVSIVQQAKVAGLSLIYKNQVLDNSAVAPTACTTSPWSRGPSRKAAASTSPSTSWPT